MSINTRTNTHTPILKFLHNSTIRGIKGLHPGNPMLLHEGDFTLDCEWMMVFKSQRKNDWKTTNYWHCRHYTAPWSVQVSPGAEISNISHCTPPHSCLLGLSSAAGTSACHFLLMSLCIAVILNWKANCNYIPYTVPLPFSIMAKRKLSFFNNGFKTVSD